MKKIILIAGIALLFASCEKPEGVGGNSTIKGKVTIKAYDKKFRVIQDTYVSADEDVYIIFGDNDTHSDEIQTAYNGIFAFKYLTKGDYTVYVFSDDTLRTSYSNEMTVSKNISVSSNNSEVDAGEFIIYKFLDVDDGFATIKGIVRQVNYAPDFTFSMDTTYAQDKDVYLIYEDDNTFSIRTRTLHNGSFAFENLIKGDYTIMVYSEDTYGSYQDVGIVKLAEIDTINQIVNLKNIYINKEQ